MLSKGERHNNDGQTEGTRKWENGEDLGRDQALDMSGLDSNFCLGLSDVNRVVCDGVSVRFVYRPLLSFTFVCAIAFSGWLASVYRSDVTAAWATRRVCSHPLFFGYRI